MIKAQPYKETITAHQATLLRAFLTCEYICDPDKYCPTLISYQTWTFSVCYGIPEASRGGVIAKAIEAGLIADMSDDDGEQVALTRLGYATLLHIDNIDISSYMVFPFRHPKMTITEALKLYDTKTPCGTALTDNC